MTFIKAMTNIFTTLVKTVNSPIMKIGVERILTFIQQSDAVLVFLECITRVKIRAKNQPFKGSKSDPRHF